MKHIGLFEGIGGFSLAAEWMGWETVAWCEWNEFGQKVLRHHFPEAEGYGDITKTDFTKYANTIDILTGGFPCQPYSNAGKRLGTEDERHLWPEMLRAVREIKPRWIVGENVLGLVSWNEGLVFHEVQTDLETEGYEVWPVVLPASSVNAPHKRDRVWVVAHSNMSGYKQSNEENEGWASKQFNGNSFQYATNANSNGLQRWGKQNNREKANGQTKQCDAPFIRNAWENFPSQPPVCNGNDGFPARLDTYTFSKWRTESIKAGGNAIVPQVAFEIYKAIAKCEEQMFINEQKVRVGAKTNT